MKKISKLLSLTLIATLFFVQCKTAGSNSSKVNLKKPESVALTFTKYLAEMNIEAAKELGTEDTKKVLDFLQMAISMAEGEELQKMKDEAAANAKNVKTAECKVDGEEAKCTICCGPEGKSLSDNEVLLKKQDGKWLVHISKEDVENGVGGGEIIEEDPDGE